MAMTFISVSSMSFVINFGRSDVFYMQLDENIVPIAFGNMFLPFQFTGPKLVSAFKMKVLH